MALLQPLFFLSALIFFLFLFAIILFTFFLFIFSVLIWQYYLYHISCEIEHQLLNKRVRKSQMRISVDFYKPNPKVFINHEIKAKKFISSNLACFEQFMSLAQKRIQNQISHSPCQMFLQIEPIKQLRVFLVDVLFQTLQRQTVAFFIFAIITPCLLQTHISQVDELVLNIPLVILTRSCPNICLLELKYFCFVSS